jgi:hypothetical protein
MNEPIASMEIKILSCSFCVSVRSVILRSFCTALPTKPTRTIVKKKAKITVINTNVAAARLFRENTKKKHKKDRKL